MRSTTTLERVERVGNSGGEEEATNHKNEQADENKKMAETESRTGGNEGAIDGGVHWVGVDCEWRAIMERHKKPGIDNSGASILQMATAEHCFVFDFASIIANSKQDRACYRKLGRNSHQSWNSNRSQDSPSNPAHELLLLLKRIFSDKNIIKCGWSFAEDLKKLKNTGNGYFRDAFTGSKSIIDVADVMETLTNSKKKGLYYCVLWEICRQSFF